MFFSYLGNKGDEGIDGKGECDDEGDGHHFDDDHDFGDV